jgi:catechol 2,3-dioxygenase-like lactoylglutathione lyase family enzyme
MLADQEPMAFLATKRPAEALVFYRDVLGLRLVADEPYAIVFETGSIALRVQKTETHEPLPYTAFGWKVQSVAQTVNALASAGVTCERFPGLDQDAMGVWTSPSGAKIAWFKDPDGNVLSLTQF